MTPEGSLMRRVALKLSDLRNVVTFRNNSGMAWQGEKLREDHSRGLLILRNARPVKFGVGIGGSDLIGWTVVEVTPEMVGSRVALFTAIEAKGTKKTQTTEAQERFIEAVRAAGGIAALVRHEDEAVAAIRGAVK